MKAIKVDSFTEENKLILVDYPAPKAGPGQVVIENEIAGVGTVDLLASKGMYPGLSEPGFIPGLEVAGVVVSAGDEEHRDLIGKRVYAMTPLGGYAEQVAVSVEALIFIPETLSYAVAVGLGINALVAAFSLERAGYGSQQKLLVRGAGGGIGSMTIILALMTGSRVTAVLSSPEKEQKLTSLGVTNFVTGKREEGISDTYDIIVDPVGGPDIDHFAKMLDNNGHYLINGIAAGIPDPAFGSALLTGFQKSLTISTLSLNSIPPSSLKSTMEYLFEMAANGRLKPVIDKVYPLANAFQAHRDLEAGSVFGKILLEIRSEALS